MENIINMFSSTLRLSANEYNSFIEKETRGRRFLGSRCWAGLLMYEPDYEHMKPTPAEQIREALDCLTIVHKSGHEGTADCLAKHLGLALMWRQEQLKFN